MSASPLSYLPQPPAGANPYEFWWALAHSILYRAPPSHEAYEDRLIVLDVLLGYLLVVAVVGLVTTIVDSRRRKKDLFLWRVVKRERGRFIVGNQRLLEPILTIIVSAILLAHVAVEHRWVHEKGSYSSVASLRLATWIAVFLQLWIVSWASLQSFILSAGSSHPALRWIRPIVANCIFLVLGIGFVVILITGVSLASVSATTIWHNYKDLKPLLESAAETWPNDITPDEAGVIASKMGIFLKQGVNTLDIMRIAVLVFAASAAVTALANIGGIALLILVRRQIKTNYNTFVTTNVQEQYELPTLPSGLTSAASHALEVELVNSGQNSAASHDFPPPPPGGIALHFTPATPLASEVAVLPSSAVSDEDGSTPSSSQKGSMQGISDFSTPSPSVSRPMSRSGSREGNKKRKVPSRSAVRRMAGSEGGGLAAAQAKNLNALHRAESDLFITCCSSVTTSITFVALSSWVYVILPGSLSLPYASVEIALFFGSWLYAFIHAIALTAHIITSWQHARVSDGPSLPSSRFDMSAHEAPGPRGDYFGESEYTPTFPMSEHGGRRVEFDGDGESDEGAPAAGAREDPSWLSPAAATRIDVEEIPEDEEAQENQALSPKEPPDDEEEEEEKTPPTTSSSYPHRLS